MDKQKEAFDKLSRLKVGALFMEMGTGKTKVALDLISSKAEKVNYILWICPCSLKSEIESERQKWHPELTLDVVGCESIGSSDRIFLEVLEKAQNHKTFIVVDESLKIKNAEAKRTVRILHLGMYSEYRLILNGTPLTRNVLDLYSQMQFLSPKILGMSFTQFKNTYTEYYIHGRLKGLVKKQHNIDHLISKIEPYIFDSELELNQRKTFLNYSYRMTEEEMEEYQAIKDSYMCRYDEDGRLDFFSLAQSLQSFYTSCVDRKALLQEILDQSEEKTIVFVKYLKSIPEGSLKIIGEMNQKEREEALRRFKADEKVLFITYGSGSFGLNLQFCRRMIFLEHSFDYAQKVQAEARIYRIGQTQDVEYINLWCSVGLERMISESLRKKTNLLDEVKKEIEKRGEKEWLKTI